MPKTIQVTAVAVVSAVAYGGTFAQDYPVKPIRMVVPFAPGGTTDIVARMLGQKLGENLGQTVVIENRGGAGGTIGTQVVAKSAPDGYTILLGVVSPLAIAVSLYGPKLGYNPVTDLAPVSMVTKVPQIFSVHPSVPARGVKDLVNLAKRIPGKINYGTGGTGSTNHLVTELFASVAGIKFSHVPYKSAGPAAVATIGGEIEMVVSAPPTVIHHIQANRLRGVAASSAKRSPVLPDVPTILESGYAGFDATAWYAMVTTGGVPRARIDRLNSALVKALEAPDVHKSMVSAGAAPESSTPDALGAFMRSEIGVWEKVVRSSGAKPD